MLSLCLAGYALAGSADPPTPVVVPVDGEPVAVQELRLDSARVSGRAGGAPRSWPLADVMAVQLRPDDLGRTPPQPTGPRLVFANGDVLAFGDAPAATADMVEVVGPAFGRTKAPVAALSSLALGRPAPPEEPRLGAWLARRREGDLALLRNFDEAKGAFAGLTAGDILWELAGKPAPLPRGRVLALSFDSGLAEKPTAAGLAIAVRLTDGSRLRLTAPKFPAGPDGGLGGIAQGGNELIFSAATVLEFAVLGGRTFSLSESVPLRTELTPYLDDSLPPRRDANVRGGPLRVGDRAFARGWGMASGTRLAFAAAGRRRFESWVGVDDAAGPLASVRFAVLVDGATKFDSGPMAAGDPPKLVRVDLADARELVLEAAFGARGDIDALADWCDARLVN